MSDNKQHTFTVTLSNDSFNKLIAMSHIRGCSATRMLEIAIQDEWYIREHLIKGFKFLLYRGKDTIKEVIFK